MTRSIGIVQITNDIFSAHLYMIRIESQLQHIISLNYRQINSHINSLL